MPSLKSLVALALVALALPAPAAPAGLTRGPYLQLATSSSVVVVWRTTGAINPVLRFGTDPGALDREVAGAAITVRVSVDVPAAPGGYRLYQEPHDEKAKRGAVHDPSTPPNTHQFEARITGLQPATRYYYAIHDGSRRLAGGDRDHAFVTHPPIGSATDLRVWVVGDGGTGGKEQARVHDAMRALVDRTGRPLDLYLHVGDMAYSDGTDPEFQDKFFAPYQATLRNTVCWPTMGNHEGHTSRGISQYGPYYDAYVLPTRAEAGGVPSGTEAYYSFDISEVHFICLNSHDLDRGSNAAMAQWLRADLEQTRAKWLIAFWHHPPYTKGSHDSDREKQLIEMRENFMPILEAAGVDLTLTGHSHIYERSMLMDGAYATPTTARGVILDDGDGNPAGDGAYLKSAGLHPHEGSVAVVTGNGGTGLGREGTMPVMRQIILEHGSVILDLKGDTLQGIMLNQHGETRDSFSIVKRGKVTPSRVADPWQPVHDISLLTSIVLSFESAAAGTAPEDWRGIDGGTAGLAVAAAGDGTGKVLRARSTAEPLRVLYQPWQLSTFDFETVVRLPGPNDKAIGLVFGHVDARNYSRVLLDAAAGAIRVSRFADGDETVLAKRKAVIVAGTWLQLSIEVGGGEVEVQYQDEKGLQEELEFKVALGGEVPKASLGFQLPANSTAEFRTFEIEDEGR
jgi:hypothetical protein